MESAENAELREHGHSSSGRVAALQCAVRFTRFARSSGRIYKNEIENHVKILTKGKKAQLFPRFPRV